MPKIRIFFCERYRKRIEFEAFEHEKGDFKVTISLGISEFTCNSENHTVLIEQADNALYDSKRGGRNKSSIYSLEKEQVVG